MTARETVKHITYYTMLILFVLLEWFTAFKDFHLKDDSGANHVGESPEENFIRLLLTLIYIGGVLPVMGAQFHQSRCVRKWAMLYPLIHHLFMVLVLPFWQKDRLIMAGSEPFIEGGMTIDGNIVLHMVQSIFCIGIAHIADDHAWGFYKFAAAVEAKVKVELQHAKETTIEVVNAVDKKSHEVKRVLSEEMQKIKKQVTEEYKAGQHEHEHVNSSSICTESVAQLE